MRHGKRCQVKSNVTKSGSAKACRAIMGAAVLSATALWAVGDTASAQRNAIEQDTKSTVVSLIAQDFSDCTNTTVKDDPNRIRGGEIKVSRQGDSTSVMVAMTASANTTYHFYLKCVRQLGDIKTDGEGVGTGQFNFSNASTGPVFAFDAYPEGAPAGNKFQSMTVNIR
jgi:hypothetical protein